MIELIEDLLTSRNIVSIYDSTPYEDKWPEFLILTHSGIRKEGCRDNWEACSRQFALQKYCEELERLLSEHINTKQIVWRKEPSVRITSYEEDGKAYYSVYSRLYLIEEQK